LARHGPPEIFNTDQGNQFTSLELSQVLEEADVLISMDGKGRWRTTALSTRRTLTKGLLEDSGLGPPPRSLRPHK
jgi:transposase InsO family protein